MFRHFSLMVAAIGSPAPVFARAVPQLSARSGPEAETSGANAITEVTGKSEKGLNGPVSARPVEPASAAQDSKPPDPDELSEDQERAVQELKKRDSEVRAHEASHAAAGGPYASAPSFEYTTGPDGKRYITGGEVKIDASAVRDNPEATIRKMEIVIRAALSPSDPSPQDQQVARQAQQNRSKAQAQVTKQRAEEIRGDGEEINPATERPGKPAASRLLQAGAAYQKAGGPTAEAAGDVIEIIAEFALVA